MGLKDARLLKERVLIQERQVSRLVEMRLWRAAIAIVVIIADERTVASEFKMLLFPMLGAN